MADLKALSRRKRLTGRELGILRVESSCEYQRAKAQGDKENPVIKDWSAFFKKERALYDEKDKRDYEGYMDLLDWIFTANAEGSRDEVVARLNLEELDNLLNWRLTAEETTQFIMNAGLTPEQIKAMPAYNKAAKGMDELIDPETLKLNEAGRKEANNIGCVRETIVNRIFYIRGFNYVLDRVGELLDVPGVKYFKINTKALDDWTRRYSARVEELKLIASGAPEPPDRSNIDGAAKKKAAGAVYKAIRNKDIGELSDNEKKEIDELIESFEGFTASNDLEMYFNRPLKSKYIN